MVYQGSSLNFLYNCETITRNKIVTDNLYIYIT